MRQPKIDPRDKDTPDDWIERDPAMIRLTGDHPFNAEASVQTLVDIKSPLTPSALHFVRNHGPVPKIDFDAFRLEVGGLVKSPRSFSMTDLIAMPSIKVPVTLTCCGNRRQEQNMIKKSRGFKWGAGAIGTAIYTGVPIKHILEVCGGIDSTFDIGSLFLCTEGCDILPNGTYGTSIKLSRALDIFGDVMLAYALNDRALTPDHGFPLRVIIPGFVGGRMVKWLSRITVTDKESDSWYHFMDNRVLPPPPIGPASGEDAEAGNWWTKPEYIINERNINSVIAYPAHSETIDIRTTLSFPSPTPTYTMKGYAYSGGGRQVTRVELSFDDGITWELANRLQYDFEPRHGEKYWCWFRWEHEVPISKLMTTPDVCVRAWDASQNTQPKDITWNLLGMMNNAWYRVKISLNSEYNLVFRHPTNVSGKDPGWMETPSAQASIALVPATTSKPAIIDASPNLTLYTLEEISKHNTKESCWIILHGLVLDCTNYLRVHPGGESSILIKGGKDATEAFDSIHSKQAKILTEKYVIGKVDDGASKAQEPAKDHVKERNVEKESKPASTPPPPPIQASAAEGKALNTSNPLTPPGSPTNPAQPNGVADPIVVTSNGGDKQDAKYTIVVVGLGMVGLRFCEKILEYDTEKKFRLVVFGEESHLAYNRVGLTNYFTHRSVPQMLMAEAAWYHHNNVELHLGDEVIGLDTSTKTIKAASGFSVQYDKCVLATGSTPMVPPIKGRDSDGVFVYRTLTDLDRILTHSAGKRRAVVVGGGLLGLEAAKACHDLGLETTILERSEWLMRRQLDKTGGEILAGEIAKLGITVLANCNTKEIISDPTTGHISKMVVDLVPAGEEPTPMEIETDMVVLSCGIIPRDNVAKGAGLTLHPRGGIMVDDFLQTSDEHVFGIGECIIHGGMLYGLVAPGYDMADVVASNLIQAPNSTVRTFTGADMSTKLKLLGVNVASFGDYFADEAVATPLVFHDPFSSTYKMLMFDKNGSRLIGGILVGDTSDYGKLLGLSKSQKPLTVSPSELLSGPKAANGAAGEGAGDLDDEAQVCSCNNVTKGAIAKAVREKNCCSVEEVKKCTKAGTSCGGCVPIVTEIFNKEVVKLGRTVIQHLCEHFKYSRKELFEIIKIKQYRTFNELLKGHGEQGYGCEICKPVAASIFASLYNDHVLDHKALQDTNDRYLANIQRDGSFSIVPRIAGGEVTPEGLLVIGQIAKDYGLYCKISGGQRIVMFGAQKHQLPEIWEKLVDAGFETGHAYGKSLRTVKSCVGSEWCRYGMRDSVRFAIDIENRYKGLRSPHKIKSAVSGCIRECAEAQNKDFGLIATDKGYNLYVCGNGGSKPKHSVLLAAEISEELVIKYVDRFLMYYVKTADKLMRTARWLEKLDGGIEYLKQVVIEDRLGIAEELEQQMQYLVDTYQDEWQTVVRDPVRRADFRQFVNTPETERTVEMVKDKIGQQRPANWPSDKASRARANRVNRQRDFGKPKSSSPPTPTSVTEIIELTTPPETPVVETLDIQSALPSLPPKSEWQWTTVAKTLDFPTDGGAVIKRGQVQIAVYNFTSMQAWYASQNMCPHKRAFVLAQGILGTDKETPKVSCPMHKKNFSLVDGSCLSGEDYTLQTFEVKIVGEDVQLLLPEEEALDAVLGTGKWMVTAAETEGEWAQGIEMEGIENGVQTAGGCASGGCGDKKLEW